MRFPRRVGACSIRPIKLFPLILKSRFASFQLLSTMLVWNSKIIPVIRTLHLSDAKSSRLDRRRVSVSCHELSSFWRIVTCCTPVTHSHINQPFMFARIFYTVGVSHGAGSQQNPLTSWRAPDTISCCSYRIIWLKYMETASVCMILVTVTVIEHMIERPRLEPKLYLN